MTTLESPYFTLNETAVYLRSSRRTIEEMLFSGRLKGKKFGRKWLIRREDCESALRKVS
jgi:excisionase family DNA binding protein